MPTTINTLQAVAQRVFLRPRFFQPAALPRHLTSSTRAHPIPTLPVLDSIGQRAKQLALPDLETTAVIGMQHVLETTATLFQSLIQLGIRPANMFFSGKCYSTNTTVAKSIDNLGVYLRRGTVPEQAGNYQAACKIDVDALWAKFAAAAGKRKISKVIILDDGGRCIEAMPKSVPFIYPSCAIEQTRGGLYSRGIERLLVPLIEVASSSVKKQIESPMIAAAILKRFKEFLPHLNLDSHSVCGVVGNGAIGHAIVDYLLSLGRHVMVYDENPLAFIGLTHLNLVRTKDISTLIANASHVFGCTGKDITADIDLFDIVERDITMISCTSEDKEFKWSLQKAMAESSRIYSDPLEDIVCLSNHKKKITILKGGFPINFDRKPSNVPARDIEITQGLLFSAVIQGLSAAKKPMGDHQCQRQMLDPDLQKLVLSEWRSAHPTLELHDYPLELLANFDDIEWIKAHSGGDYVAYDKFKEVFSIASLHSRLPIR